ncbi:MAG: hypothetical protein FJX76_15680 [Armatimonadetes bacterium]|nr:hypothetical protein [Armatimonadota bacterium]
MRGIFTVLILVGLLAGAARADGWPVPDGWTRASDNMVAAPGLASGELCVIVFSPERDVSGDFAAWFTTAVEKANGTNTTLRSSAVQPATAGGYEILTQQAVLSDPRLISTYRTYVAVRANGKAQFTGMIASTEPLLEKFRPALGQFLDGWRVGGQAPVGAANVPVAAMPAAPDAEALLTESQAALDHAKGWQALIRGRYSEALAAFDSARKQATGDAALAAAAGAQTCLVHLGRFEEAVALGTDVLKQARDSLLAARAHVALADAYRGLLRYEEALREARAALRAAGAFTAAYKPFTGTVNRASATRARQAYESGMEARRACARLAEVLLLLGCAEEVVALLEGDGYRALNDALAADRATLRAALTALLTAPPLVDAQLEIYQADDAVSAYLACIALAVAQQTIALDTRRPADWQMALDSLQHAQALVDQGRPFEPAHQAVVLLQRAALLRDRKDWTGAQKEAVAALALMPKVGDLYRAPLELECRLILASVSLELDPKAVGIQISAAQAVKSATDPTAAWRLLDLQGQLEEKLGRLPQAVEMYGAAVRLIEKERGGIQTAELKRKFFRTRHHVYEHLLRALLLLGRAEDAFLVMERVRARTLLDLLATVNIRKGMSAGLAKRVASEQDRAVALAVEVNRGRAADPRALQDAAARTFEEILKESPELADLRGAEPL